MSPEDTTRQVGGAASARRSRWLPGPSGPIRATVGVPPSKSLTNRAFIAAAVAGGGAVQGPLECEDTDLLARALESAGWSVDRGGTVRLGPRQTPGGRVTLDLGNSGTGSRLLLALLAAVPGHTVVDGSERLRERPMAPLLEALRGLGARVSPAPGDRLPVSIDGCRLAGGRLELEPQVSSQFVSALLLAAPLMAQGLELELHGTVPSRPYLRLTLDVLGAFGAEVETDADLRRWRVRPVPLRPVHYAVEGDWSAAAFFAAAAAVTAGEATIDNLSLASAQGDRAIVEVLASAGAEVEEAAGALRVRGTALRPFTADLRDGPDMFPALAVVAAAARPGSRLTGLEHLLHKESDRLSVMVENLRRLGARFEVERDAIAVTGSLPGRLAKPVDVTAAADHRIAMAMAVAALVAGPLALDDGECVAKSFPGFWEEWAKVAR